MPRDFEILPHTADFRLKVYGKTKKELFGNALIGMFQGVDPRAQGCERKDDRLVCPTLPQKHAIKLQSSDINSLLVDFLSEALYLSDINNEAYLDAKITKLFDTEIEAEIYGIKIQGFEEVEIKAVTHHESNIKWTVDHWETVIVFDI